ncbi:MULTISPECIES: sensor histidine kinase [Rhodococcus]|uniref:histidine kinase n=1 Tax=Rhodococcus jostii TaxID=132919 RepID=A0ABU4CF85_RHOJO|nr:MULTISPECIES: histidine kinase [Rhodococcus]MDI9954760.1 histidine kinase [Rhodococcus sp. IEGM 1305]MDV6282215.1 histidine kinase [Rhodococcus jostii]
MTRVSTVDSVKTKTRIRRAAEGQWLNVAIVVVTAILFAVAWPTLQLTHQVSPPIQPFVAALATFPFLLIRSNPALAWAVSAISALVIPRVFALQGGYDYPWQVVHILVMLALLAAVSMRAAIPVVGVAWISTVLLFLADTPGTNGRGWAVGLTAIVVFGLLIRWLVLSRRQLAQQEELSELERTRRTVLEEKARIARDLHDVVAHHMSMVVVQAQSAPYRIADMSDETRAEFESIGAAGRAALNEVRGLLGVLRSDGQLAEHAPQPGVQQISELLEGSRRAGIPVSWHVDGDPTLVSESVGLVMYRILQESLANTARHAAGAAVEVKIAYESPIASVSIVNGPPRRSLVSALTRHESTGGNGIIGMRERAQAVGGVLTTHLHDNGGFEVHAEFPVASA